MKRTLRPLLAPAFLAVPLLMIASGAEQPGAAGASPPAHLGVTLAPLTAEETRFEGRWMVDVARLAPAITDDHCRKEIMKLAVPLILDIRADRTALLLVGDSDNASLFNWKVSDGKLVNTIVGAKPRGTQSEIGGRDGGGVHLELEDDTVVMKVDWVYYGAESYTFPLKKIARAADAATPPSGLLGAWQLNYERTLAAVMAEHAEVKKVVGKDRRGSGSIFGGGGGGQGGGGAGGDGTGGQAEAPEVAKDEEAEVQSVAGYEDFLKSKLGGWPPYFVFNSNIDGGAKPVGPDSKEGKASMTWRVANSHELASHSWGTWSDMVVLYARDGWHGIKPNTSVIRVTDGGKTLLLRVDGLPLVLEPVPH